MFRSVLPECVLAAGIKVQEVDNLEIVIHSHNFSIPVSLPDVEVTIIK